VKWSPRVSRWSLLRRTSRNRTARRTVVRGRRDGRRDEAIAGAARRIRGHPNCAVGNGDAFRGCREDGPNPHDLMVLRVGIRRHRICPARTWIDRSWISIWLADGTILADVLDGFHSRFVSYGSDGSRNDTPMFVSNPRQFMMSANGNVAFVGETATEAPSCGFGTGRTRRARDASERRLDKACAGEARNLQNTNRSMDWRLKRCS